MKMYIWIILAFATSSMLAQPSTISLAVTPPPATLTLFGENSISTFSNERDFAMSPDGKEIYYTVSTPKSSVQTIVFCKQVKAGVWTSPEVVSFAGTYSDLEPAFSADGKTLYFSSNRPVAGTMPGNFDIWKVTRAGSGWSTPVNLGSPVNTEADEFYPSVASNGNLYFTAAYARGIGKEDIYLAAFSKNEYQKPIALDTAVNSKLYEFNAFVSPDERYILFTSYGRKDDAGGGDLYMSEKGVDGKWQVAINLKSINSRQLDYCPYVSPDGKTLFITSERHQLPTFFSESRATYQQIVDIGKSATNGTGNIYWIDFNQLKQSIK